MAHIVFRFLRNRTARLPRVRIVLGGCAVAIVLWAVFNCCISDNSATDATPSSTQKKTTVGHVGEAFDKDSRAHKGATESAVHASDTRHASLVPRRPSSQLQASNSTRYLIGVCVYGPNNQYYSFFSYMAMAAALNRTLVLLPFREHYLRATGNDFRYFAFEETFDVDALQRAGPDGRGERGIPRVITLDRFLPAWDGRVSLFWQAAPGTSPRERFWVSYSESVLRPIAIERTMRFEDWEEGDLRRPTLLRVLGWMEPSWPVIVVDFVFRSVGVHYALSADTLTHAGLAFRDRHLRTVRAVSHAPDISAKAVEFITETIATTEYIAVHWRRADIAHDGDAEGEGGGSGNCTQLNKCVEGITVSALLDALDSAVLAAASVRRDSSPRTWPVFLSSLRFSEEERSAFAARGYGTIFRYPPAPPGSANYFESLIEQEICMRARAFVASRSTWSDRVLETRIATPSRTLTWPSQVTRPAGPGTPVASQPAALPPFRFHVLAGSSANGADVACGYEFMGISTEAPRNMTLACLRGGRMASVLFASFGRPRGLCGAFAMDETCHSALSTQRVAALCVGRSTCTISVSRAEFDLRCETGGYALAAYLSCEGKGS